MMSGVNIVKVAAVVAMVVALGVAAHMLGAFSPTRSASPGATRPDPATSTVAAPAAASLPAGDATLESSNRPEASARELAQPSPAASKRAIGHTVSTDSRSRFPRATEVGYGAFVDEALAARDPELMAQAAGLIRTCNAQDSVVDGLRRQRLSQPGDVTSEPLLLILQAEEDIQRRCQAVSPTHKAQLVPMLAVAAQRHVPGSATQLLAALGDEGKDPAAYPWLLDALVADAERGEGVAFHPLACGDIGVSLPMKQRATYFAALEVLASRSGESSYRFMAQHCWRPIDPGVQADAQQVNRLVAAVDARHPR